MITILIILTVISLAVGVTALVIALKKQSSKEIVKTEKVVRVEHAPVEHPFVYDENKKTYILDGNFYVTGSVSALNVFDK